MHRRKVRSHATTGTGDDRRSSLRSCICVAIDIYRTRTHFSWCHTSTRTWARCMQLESRDDRKLEFGAFSPATDRLRGAVFFA
jgi:hypothetical protein